MMQLTNSDITNRSALKYKRFVAKNQLFTSSDYERSNKHHNFDIHVELHSRVTYGEISGLYVVKPDCKCNQMELQYCRCVQHSIVLCNAMKSIGQPLYRDLECNAKSEFLQEVVLDSRVFGIYPSETMMSKCIRIALGQHTYLCKLPYRFQGD